MENTKKKKNDTIRKVSFWRQHYPLLSVILIIGSLLVYISIIRNNVLSLENESIIYPLFLTPKPIVSLSLTFMPVILFLVVLFVLSSREPLHKYNVASVRSDFIAFSLAIFLGCGISIYFFATFLSSVSYIHMDRFDLDNQTYMLTSHFVPDDSLTYGTYIIFECDKNGITCAQIFETSSVNNIHDPAELAYDETTHQFSIITNGEVIETVQLE